MHPTDSIKAAGTETCESESIEGTTQSMATTEVTQNETEEPESHVAGTEPSESELKGTTQITATEATQNEIEGMEQCESESKETAQSMATEATHNTIEESGGMETDESESEERITESTATEATHKEIDESESTVGGMETSGSEPTEGKMQSTATETTENALKELEPKVGATETSESELTAGKTPITATEAAHIKIKESESKVGSMESRVSESNEGKTQSTATETTKSKLKKIFEKQVDYGEEFLGYEEEDIDIVYDATESQSSAMHAVCYELQAEHAAIMAELFALQTIPFELKRRTSEGSSIYIDKVIIHTNDPNKMYTLPMILPPDEEYSIGMSSPGSEGDLIIDEGVVSQKKVNNKFTRKKVPTEWHAQSPPFSRPELQLLRRPLEYGWIRDVVLKSDDGSSPGKVSYFAPDGVMIRSYKDLAVALAKPTKGGLTRANFSFTARPIGGSKNEVVRRLPSLKQANDLRRTILLQPKPVTPRKRKQLGSESAFTNSPASSLGSPLPKLVPVGQSPSAKRRRGFATPSPKNTPKGTPKNSLIEKMQVNDAEGGLFGISALSEIFAGMEKADAERELEEYSRMMSLMAAQENVLEAMDPTGGACTVTEDGELVARDEVLPCSIRCPGLADKVPELQCVRCLCLYHTECLGLPEDTDPTDFLCANCEGTDDGPTSTPTAVGRSPSLSPSKDVMYDLMHKMLDPKTTPATTSASAALSPASRLFQGFGKQISIKKIDTPRSVDNSPTNRGRRIPAIPQLTSHNLTITPLVPFGKGQIPRVPNLSPMNKSSNTSIPVFKRGRGGALSTLVDTIQMSPQRQGQQLSKLAQDSPNRTKQQRYPIPNFGSSFGTMKPPTSNIFRNYPQSVVSVGQRKFIVIPKSPPPNVMEMFEQQSGSKYSSGSGHQRKFLAEVFKYLTVRDLMKASYINRAWRDEARKPRLWKELRLRNTRIYDVYSFAEFVAARETETIDFRKMLGTVSWRELFHQLCTAPALKTLILGSKAEELGQLARQFCPHLEVIDFPAS